MKRLWSSGSSSPAYIPIYTCCKRIHLRNHITIHYCTVPAVSSSISFCGGGVVIVLGDVGTVNMWSIIEFMTLIVLRLVNDPSGTTIFFTWLYLLRYVSFSSWEENDIWWWTMKREESRSWELAIKIMLIKTAAWPAEIFSQRELLLYATSSFNQQSPQICGTGPETGPRLKWYSFGTETPTWRTILLKELFVQERGYFVNSFFHCACGQRNVSFHEWAYSQTLFRSKIWVTKALRC